MCTTATTLRKSGTRRNKRSLGLRNLTRVWRKVYGVSF
ncbi:hypothetical protein LEP1GSC124_1714 [Leptospira interrogans serovar Pyrogenes str. 200701872]|uniref:Uncharacterized protein n=1 Tax=Leptospira interrogans serovar Pyrogenes str. 200701872 TaxID=1193029 RepID=M7AF11_LEPIR|nr:hypothetical protein LEP1GSC124_1714 [Leptospira interrogans serovar Pyrogenes str. 200701872]